MRSPFRLLAFGLFLCLPLTAARAQTPVSIDPIDDVTMVEGESKTLDVRAVDPDAGTIELSASLPAFATLNAPTSSTASDTLETTITLAPGTGTAGMYDASVTAMSGGDTATEPFAITVQLPNTAPVALDPIDDVTMEEGESVTVPVRAVDPDAAPIELSASLPAFATLDAPTSSTASDTLETTITIEPGTGTAGLYDASVTATSQGDTATEPFAITVTAPALEASAELIGAFNVHKKFICFKVWPVEESFDLRDADLTSLTLSYGGESIGSVRPTHLAYDCDDSCEECEGTGEGAGEAEDCEPSHIMACFSMSDLQALFDEAALPESLAVATIEGDLSGGQSFVAWIGGKHIERGAKGEQSAKVHSLRVSPNPMNPSAKISFTITQAGRVRVSIYDLNGRLVRTIGDNQLAAGSYTMPWDGSTRTGGRAASGVYFVKVASGGASAVQRVTVLK